MHDAILFFKHSPDLLGIVGSNSHFKKINPAFEALLGYSEAEMLSRPVMDFLHPDDLEKTRAGIAVLASGKPRFGSRNRYRCKDGSYKWISWNTTPIGDDFYSIGRDITEQVAAEEQVRELNQRLESSNENLEKLVQQRLAELRQTEAQVLQLQKMDALGRLAGGVAHDFNNMLAAQMISCDLLAEDAENPAAVREHTATIREGATRASALTRQLLLFSRKQLALAETIDLNSLITDLEKMLVRLIGENIRIVLRLSPDLYNIKADPNQIEQVVMNLVVNARDAMPNGGKITIETKNSFLDDSFASKHLSAKPGDYAQISITDEGIGMDAGTTSRIFEPFFTTKPAGKGTGLGLTTTYGIVKQNSGSIWVYSEPSKGTVFKIYLPAAGHDGVRKKRPAENKSATLVSGTILLVEDEPSLRTVFSMMLTRKGFSVLAAANAAEALKFSADATRTIDLLLTDVMIPDMNGFELVRKITEQRAGLKVLYMSGYTDETLESSGLKDQTNLHFIQKPFGIDALIHKVTNVLDPDRLPG